VRHNGVKLLHQYLVWRQVVDLDDAASTKTRHERIQQMLLTLEAIARLQLPRRHWSELRTSIAKRIASSPRAHPTWHLDNFQLSLVDIGASAPAVNRKGDEAIRHALGQLDRYYLAERLRLCAELHNKSHLLSTRADEELTPHMLSLLESGLLNDSLAVRLYTALYNLMKDPHDDKAWLGFRELLLDSLSELESTEAGPLMTVAINACIIRVVSGKPEFNKEATILFKKMDANNLLAPAGTLSPWLYRSMIEMMLRCGEVKLAETYAEKYRQFLPATHAFMWDCVQMQIAIHSERYEDAHRLLHGFQSLAKRTDANFILWVKSCEVCINLAISNPDLGNSVDAMAKLIQRSKGVSPERRKVWKNFIRVAKTLSSRLPAGNRDHREALTKVEGYLMETGAVAQRDWLLKWIRSRKKALR
jgi:hypothetical protein